MMASHGRYQVLLLVAIFTGCGVLSCPDVCQCRLEDEGHSVVTICNGQSLASIPPGLPVNTTILRLRDNNITSIDPSLLSHMPGLLELDISENLITFLGNNTFSSNLGLTKLYLSSNLIQHVDPAVFSGLKQLTILDLSDNKIRYLELEIFLGLQHLGILNMSYNSISAIENGTFQSQVLLKVLDLSYNSMLTLTDTSLVGLDTISELYLSGCDIYDLLVLNSNSTKTLQLLDLRDNSIPYLDTSTFPQLVNLKYLYLDKNNISFIAEDAFCGLSHKITRLTLDANPIDSIEHHAFNCLQSLTSLSISFMPNLQYIHSIAFQELHNLQTVNISHNHMLAFIHGHAFKHAYKLRQLDLSYNNLSRINIVVFSFVQGALDLSLEGNHLICECGIEWLLQAVQSNTSQNINKAVISVKHKEQLKCKYENNSQSIPLLGMNVQDIICDNVSLSKVNDKKVFFKIGSTALLQCKFSGYPPPSVTWATPRGKTFHFHHIHPLAIKEYPSFHDVQHLNGSFHLHHDWHETSQYRSDLADHRERITLLDDGSLYIDYILRSDAGLYKCMVENSRSSDLVEIVLRFDYSIVDEVKLMSLLVGLGCAVSFFMLNLIYATSSALARRCINQRRREAILQLVENLDIYKTTQMAKLRENYNTQFNKIRETYHQRLQRIRSNYTTQISRLSKGASHLREGASNKVCTIRGNYKSVRENYHGQITKLREYSSHQLEQLREMYSHQVLKVRDYGSAQLGRFHHKYKLQQQHVMKLLEMMNVDNCRNVFETECVRTESIILEADFNEETPITIPSPVDSVSVNSDSEYVTASSEESSPHSSQENLSHYLDRGDNSLHSAIYCVSNGDQGLSNTQLDDSDTFLQSGVSSHINIHMIDSDSDSIEGREFYRENETYV